MTSKDTKRRRAGFSMVGLLITLVCIVVLSSILMTSLNEAVTGQGSQKEGTVDSFTDKLYLSTLFQAMFVYAAENNDEYLVPHKVARGGDVGLNTTANLYSAMVMARYTPCKQLISGNEYSGYVDEKFDYNFALYDPQNFKMWDPTFVADLQSLSNVSFSHMPLHGERLKKNWRTTMNSAFPLLGNRGPKDGVATPNSFACGRDGAWRGHIVFGEGHVDFVDKPTPSGVIFEQGGLNAADNIFKMESGANGEDAILAFTKVMKKTGPELQFD